MTSVNQLLQGSVKPGSEQNEKLLAASLTSVYEASSGLFDMYPLTEIIDRFTSQIHAIVTKLPEEGNTVGERVRIQNDIYFLTEWILQILLIHERAEEVAEQKEERRTELQNIEGALAYSKIMMQRTLHSVEERVN